MNFLFLGDIVGRSGRDIVLSELPKIKANEEIDFVIVNGENAAGGYGITKKICDELFSVGVDAITSGNHICCLLYTSPSPRDRTRSRMPSSA